MRKKLLTFLALLTVIFALPQVAKAWTFYVDISNTNWTTVWCNGAYKYSDNSGTWSGNYQGTSINGSKIFKITISGYSDLKAITFTDSSGRKDSYGANTQYGDFTTGNGSANWAVTDGALYVLSGSDQGATVTSGFNESSVGPENFYIYSTSGPTKQSITFTKNSTNTTYTASGVTINSSLPFVLGTVSNADGNWTTLNNYRYSPSSYSDTNIVSGTAHGFGDAQDNGAWTVAAGKYDITINWTAKTIKFVKLATKTLTAIDVKKDNGSWTNINGSSNATEYSGITSSNKFLVRATYSESGATSYEYYYVNGTPESTGSKTLTEGTSSKSFNFASSVYKVKFYVTESNGTFTLTVSTISKSGLSPKSANNYGLVTNDGGYVLRNKYDNRGTETDHYFIVNYTGPASSQHRAPGMTLPAGEYTSFSETEDIDEATFATNSTFTCTAVWNDNGTPQKLTISDPNAITWEIYGTLTSGTSTSYPMTYDSGLGMWKVEITPTRVGNDGKFTVRKKVGSTVNATYSGDYWFNESNRKYTVQTSGNNLAYNMGSGVECVFYLNANNMMLYVEPKKEWSLYGQCATGGSNYEDFIYLTHKAVDSDIWEAEYNFPHQGMFYVRHNNSDSNADKWAGDYWFTNENTTYNLINGNDGSVKWNVKFAGATNKNYKITFNSSTHQLSINEVKEGLNFKPYLVRKANGNMSAWPDAQPIVVITADYLNNNRLQPDWEMERRSDGKYHLDNVTLRGSQSTSGTTTSSTLTAHVIYKNGSGNKTVSLTPDSSLGLETATERQYGRRYNLTYDPDTSTLSIEKSGSDWDLPPFFSLVGYNFQQKTMGATPRGNSYTTSSGWQEAWVLYENNYPLRDNDGNYIYSTQWPPKKENNILFNVVKDGNPVTLQSSDLIFTRDTDHATSTHNVMTGAQWESTLKGENATAYANLDLVDGTYYARYYVPKVWIYGATKIWSGWGGKTQNAETADWSSHQNFGHSDKNYDNEDGTVIAPYTTHNVEMFGGNFMFDKPTYFETFEMFLPSVQATGLPIAPDENGSDADKNTKVYTTKAIANAQILAQSTDDYHGSYIASIELPDGWTYDPNSVVITRYWVDGAEKPNKAGTYDDKEDYTIHSPVLHTSESSTYTKEELLENGTYYYILSVTVTDQNNVSTTVTAKSTPFSIANLFAKADVKCMQLLRLSDAMQAKYGYTNITYLPGSTGKYYFVDRATSQLTEASNAAFEDITSSRANFLFTDDFYVKVLDVEKFNGTFTEGIAQGFVKGLPTDLKVYVKKGTSMADNDYVGAVTTVSNTSSSSVHECVLTLNKYYGKVITTGGDLTNHKFVGGMKYSYLDADGSASSRGLALSSDVDDDDPEMPTAWGAKYEYRHAALRDENKNIIYDNEGKEIPDIQPSVNVKSVYGYGDWLYFEVPSATPHKVNVPVLMKADDLDPRQLDVVFTFQRPNVTEDILQYYDITYDIDVETNYHNEHILSASGVYYDEHTESFSPAQFYSIRVLGVHPSQSFYPTLKVKSTRYERHVDGEDPNNDGVLATYGDNISLEATSVTQKLGGSITGLKINYADSELKTQYANNPNDALNAGWAEYLKQPGFTTEGRSWMYFGHSEFIDEGDVLVRGNEDQTQLEIYNESSNNPHYYLIETYIDNNNHASYAYLVKHQAGHLNDEHYVDPLSGKWIAHGFNSTLTPTVYVTPIYIFNRLGEGVGTETMAQNSTAEFSLKRLGIDASSNVSKAPRRLPAQNEYLDEANYTGVKLAGYTKAAAQADNMKITSFAPGGSAAGELTASAGGEIAGTAIDTPTGIESIRLDNSDYEAEYFNLQGIRIENPIKGQVYVVRRGAAVTKEVVR